MGQLMQHDISIMTAFNSGDLSLDRSLVIQQF